MRSGPSSLELAAVLRVPAETLGAGLTSFPHPALGSPSGRSSETGPVARRGVGEGHRVRTPTLGLVFPSPSGPCGTPLGRTGSPHRDNRGRSLWINKS